MKVQTKGLRFVSVMGVVLGALAGCQAEGTKFVRSGQRDPEQLGMKVGASPSFGREGSLSAEPNNLGRFYRDNGTLNLDVYRISNASSETVELYPILATGAEPALKVREVLLGFCPRTVTECWVDLGRSLYRPEDLLSEYVASFDLVGAEVRFESGGTEAVEIASVPEKAHPLAVRAGESGTLRLKFAMRADSPLIPSESLVGTGMANGGGMAYFPKGLKRAPIFLPNSVEQLVSLSAEARVDLTLLARNKATDELNPLYFGKPVESFTVYDGKIATEKVARRISGLPVLE
ncbi:MAG: hypothetical protein JST04_01310 [Bdellovibrionales bacterium]|nr:hypothetical protein [Bdellovibrionales bacterium]